MTESIPQSLLPMINGNPSQAMEIAKQIIGGKLPVEHRQLAAIAKDPQNSKWSRIAAIYALGFLADKEFVDDLRKLLADRDTDPDIRSHAAEALGNIRDRGSIILLRNVLRTRPTGPLLESCNYALNEMDA
jgi:HEAT repeat protein